MLRAEDYTVGWVSALPVELAAAAEMLDEEHPALPHDPNDENIYTLGRIGCHNVVIVCLPAGRYGTTSAATAAIQMKAKFPAIRFGLMVGVGGGVPSATDVRLGDVVVSQPSASHGGVVQYDSGTTTASGFVRKGFLNAPPPILLNSLSKLRANHLRQRTKVMEHLSAFDSLPLFQRGHAGVDRLFKPTYTHAGGPMCEACDDEHVVTRTPRTDQAVEIHYGTIASGNQVIRNAETRDQLSAELGGVLCFEMEAAGLMNGFPCLVIRGVCDYCDSHKNKDWQPFAAATAAAYAKDLLSVVPAAHVSIVTTEQSTSLAFHSKTVRVRQAQGLNRPVWTNRDRLFEPREYVRDNGSSISGRDSLTSNVFKRPDVLISRCSDALGELQALAEGNRHTTSSSCSGSIALSGQFNTLSHWTSNTNWLERLHSEMQWCLSSIDILLDVLLRSDRQTPTRLQTESKHAVPQPRRLAHRTMGQVIKPSDTTKKSPSSIGYAPSWISNTPDTSLLRSIAASGSILPFTVPEPKNITIPEAMHITIPGAYNIDIPRPVSTERQNSSIPTHHGLRVEDRTMSRDVPTAPSRPSDPPPLSSSTPPEVWLTTIRVQLLQWADANLSPSTKRARRRYVISALTSLNNYIASIEDVANRRRLRDELEQYGLLQLIVNMKAAVGDLVMLEKQVEVYFDDKMEDGVAY
ncbi:uncharacterized protein DSM5745_01824 [Aspergillus mulundensis]|uniref:Nucleoside phosphorylase domain-containing protein n=1 Tax=Aspergillus mulundensis TaxID=1810919 RepID=A0A3D8SUV5_9EURO|nr:hypothetical protein DSM5745_01824 [Aspergillus mulundensis]RDW90049.1 hypothetical protein DSM5745_01824 [Aspergillus mulundensis]